MLTIFVEGSANERRELAALEGAAKGVVKGVAEGGARSAAGEMAAAGSAAAAQDATAAAHDAAILRHPLVRIHGVDPKAMRLVRVHKEVEGGHRRDAWQAVLANVPEALEDQVAGALEHALGLWLAYRDEVAAASGIHR